MFKLFKLFKNKAKEKEILEDRLWNLEHKYAQLEYRFSVLAEQVSDFESRIYPKSECKLQTDRTRI